MLKELLRLLVCPDCKGDIKQIEIKNQLLGFFCDRCQTIYPIREGIPILLAKQARNYKLEYPLIMKIRNKLSNNSFGQLHEYIKITSDLLISRKEVSSWEWEDEEFWSRKYARERITKVPKNWNNRIWERECLVKELTSRSSLKNKTILDIGCGEGQNFRFLLSKYCNRNSIYIATDVSFEALKLNRSRNRHKNSLYVLCSADYELPFPNNTVDVLCYFGILHHTKNKATNICKDKKLVKRGGYIIVHEAVHRPTPRQLSCLMPKAEKSAHEEHIRKESILAQMTKEKGVEVVFIREKGTPLFTGVMTLFSDILVRNKKLFLVILNLDILIVRTLGRLLPFFRAGEIQLLARKISYTPHTL